MTISILSSSTEYLKAVLAAAVATTEPNYSIIWEDTANNPSISYQEVGALTSDTLKTLLSGGTSPKKIKSLEVYNGDSASVSITVSKYVVSTGYTLVNVTIPAGGTLRWNQERGIEVLSTSGVTPSDSVGAVVAGIGVVAVESGFGNFRRTILTLTATPLTITDALAYAGLKLYDFPAGRINILDCVTSLAFTTTSVLASTLNTGSTVAYGIGSVTASATTLATTMMNMMPGSGETVKEFTSSTTINVAGTTVTGFLAAVSAAHLAAILNGTSTPIDLFLNVAVPTGTDIDADATLTVSGTITVTWINGGDV